MGQGYSRLCNGSSSRREPGAGRWKRLKTEGGGKVVRQGSPCSGLVSVQPPQGSSSAVSSTEANDDKRDHDLEEPAGESAWDGEGLEDSEVDKGGETPTYKYISMKSESGKAPKKRKWHGKVSSYTSNASTSVPKEVTPLQPNDIILAGNERSQTGNTFRPGSLPAVITDSKPMKDAHRLLGVLTEHAHADELSEEGPSSYVLPDSISSLVPGRLGVRGCRTPYHPTRHRP
ncbi:uncharacterized protein LOC110975048 isoform X2 [Acanthaster planci]|uniref:Uncharacterized protein LOC110975048 isoform X2 n=1 Tax=Acanthaster planci TaxID=133434 RepID=A0A8B7XSA3_ACAPL|nr:uncharacterized protein LOC110975048 isoform X2 [Acanthaster planci]